MPSSRDSVGLARAHPLTKAKAQAMAPVLHRAQKKNVFLKFRGTNPRLEAPLPRYFSCATFRDSAILQPCRQSKNAPPGDGLLGTLTTYLLQCGQSDSSCRAVPSKDRDIVAEV